jgi:hypothetical protein
VWTAFHVSATSKSVIIIDATALAHIGNAGLAYLTPSHFARQIFFAQLVIGVTYFVNLGYFTKGNTGLGKCRRTETFHAVTAFRGVRTFPVLFRTNSGDWIAGLLSVEGIFTEKAVAAFGARAVTHLGLGNKRTC